MSKSIRNITTIICTLLLMIGTGVLLRYATDAKWRLEGKVVTGVITYADEDVCVLTTQWFFIKDRVLLAGVPLTIRQEGTMICCRLTDIGVASGPPMAPIYGKAENVTSVGE